MNNPKKSKRAENPNPEEPTELHIPDRHFRSNEPESDYSMDELDRKDDDPEEEPDFDEIRKEQDDDE